MMNLKHTNLPNHIQNQLQAENNQISIELINQKPIQFYIVNLRKTQNIVIIHDMVSNIRKRIYTQNGIYALTQSGILPYLVDLARKQISPQLTVNIMRILFISDNMIHKIIENGCIQMFIEFMESKIEFVQQAALKILKNIAGCTEYRDLILQLGGLEKIISIYQNQPRFKLDAFNCICDICFTILFPTNEQVRKAIDICCEIILDEQQNSEILLTTLNYLNQFLLQHNKFVKSILQKNVVKRLINLFNQGFSNIQLKIQYNVLEIIHLGVKTEQILIDFVLEANILNELSKIFQHNIFLLDKKIYRIIELITACNHQSMISVLYNEYILDQLLQFDQKEVETEFDQHAVLVVSIISNCIKNSQKQDLQFLMEKGLFRLYKKIYMQKVLYFSITLNNKIIRQIIAILKKGNEFSENYYLIELKQLELDELIKNKLWQSPNTSSLKLYDLFVKLL